LIDSQEGSKPDLTAEDAARQSRKKNQKQWDTNYNGFARIKQIS
jgi:hypothetical protein